MDISGGLQCARRCHSPRERCWLPRAIARGILCQSNAFLCFTDFDRTVEYLVRSSVPTSAFRALRSNYTPEDIGDWTAICSAVFWRDDCVLKERLELAMPDTIAADEHRTSEGKVEIVINKTTSLTAVNGTNADVSAFKWSTVLLVTTDGKG